MGEIDQSITYDFNEPVSFPFEVNEVRTEVEIINSVMQQVVFHYKNKQSTQEIRYILSKVIDKPQKLSDIGTPTVELNNGKQAYYEESETIQSIWWEEKNGFLARYVYYINGNMSNLSDFKLKKSDFIELVNQVQ